MRISRSVINSANCWAYFIVRFGKPKIQSEKKKCAFLIAHYHTNNQQALEPIPI